MNKIISIWIFPLIVLGFILSTINNCNSQPTSYPIDSKVFTTHERTVVPVPVPNDAEKIFPYEISKYAQNGYGVWKFGPGLEYEKRLDIMSPAYSNTSVSIIAKLLNFFTITDIHLTDKESPSGNIVRI